jgi:hypothetical protein
LEKGQRKEDKADNAEKEDMVANNVEKVFVTSMLLLNMMLQKLGEFWC